MTDSSPLKVAVVGFGKLGLLHAGLANGLPGSKLVAVCDQSSTSMNVLKSQMKGVKTYSNYKDMIADGGLDAVFIATPTGSHVPIAIDFVKAGIAVFIEKPLSPTAEQARPLLDALEQNPVTNMVGYMGRYIDTFAKAKELIASNALGRLQMLRTSMYVAQLFTKGKGWRYDQKESGGGVLITQNGHVIDKLLWMFGDLEYVTGHTNSLYSPTVEDHAHAFFAFKSGLTGFMDASWSARHYRTPTISIHVQGENGTLDVNDDDVRLFLTKPHGDLPADWSMWRGPDLYQAVPFDIGGPQYTLQAIEFLNAVRDKGQVDSDVASAFKTQTVIDAIYHSAEQNGAPQYFAEQ